MTDNLLPVKVIDKNGKLTTVRKRSEDIRSDKRARSSSLPPNLAAESERQLLAEVESEYARVSAEIAVLDAEQQVIVDKRTPLRSELDSLLDIKMELEAGKVTIDSPIEDIKVLNKYAFYHSGAASNEKAWLAALHPKLRSDGYEPDYDLPKPSVDFTYGEDVDDSLVEAMLKFSTVLADGRDVVRFGLLTGNYDNTYDIAVEPETGNAAIMQSGYYNVLGDKPKTLHEVIEYVTKNLPFTYPDSKREELYPSDNDYR